MLKLMIVDDEHIVREGIRFMIENAFDQEIQVVAMAKTGREAIEMFEEFRPHIVFMDIQMPGINGIDAIGRIRTLDSRVKFVIVSAYEQFEYAKSAVQLGVEEYLLKPINKAKLIEILAKIIKDLQDEKRLKEKEIETQEKLDQILPVLEYGYIYSIIMNTDYQKENVNYHQLLDINKDMAYMMVIDLGDIQGSGHMSNRIGTGVRGNARYDKIRNIIKYKCKAVVGPLMVNRIPVLVYEDMPANEYQQRVYAIEVAEGICEKISELTESEVFIGIGGCYRLHRMNISYNEAIKAISKISDEKVLHIMDAINNATSVYSFLKIKSDEEVIVRKVEEGQVEEVGELLALFFSKLEKHYGEEIDLVKSVITELMVLIFTTGYRNAYGTAMPQNVEYVEIIKGFNQLFELKSWCLAKAREITEGVRLEKENKVSSVITEAMTYIDDNFNEDLRLKDVAEAVAISPQYFSKIFKKEIGVNFIDYLTKVRMEHAKLMLKENQLSIKEICFKIGYNDPNYFSRLFKKVEGVSPTEYQ